MTSLTYAVGSRVSLCCLLSAVIAVSSAYSQIDSFRKLNQNSRLILTNVTVHDKQRALAIELNKSAFALYDNKEAQEITYFNNEDQPISLDIIADGIDPNS
jgi:hypothetical protein